MSIYEEQKKPVQDSVREVADPNKPYCRKCGSTQGTMRTCRHCGGDILCQSCFSEKTHWDEFNLNYDLQEEIQNDNAKSSG